MRLGNVGGHCVRIEGDRCARLDEPSQGRYRTPADVYGDWDAFTAWMATDPELTYEPLVWDDLQAPVDRPGQVFGVGLNYHDHLEEIGRGGTNPLPLAFTKFPSTITGPFAPIEVATDQVDYEVELVLIIGRDVDRAPAGSGWDYVAAVTVGQDISARDVQVAGQLSLGKSFRGFAPIGPVAVTVDELEDRDALAMTTTVNGTVLQDTNSSLMVHPVADLIPFLTTFTALRAGDIVFTGTGAGVAIFRKPQPYLRPGDLLECEIAGIGAMRNPMVAPSGQGAYHPEIAALAKPS